MKGKQQSHIFDTSTVILFVDNTDLFLLRLKKYIVSFRLLFENPIKILEETISPENWI